MLLGSRDVARYVSTSKTTTTTNSLYCVRPIRRLSGLFAEFLSANNHEKVEKFWCHGIRIDFFWKFAKLLEVMKLDIAIVVVSVLGSIIAKIFVDSDTSLNLDIKGIVTILVVYFLSLIYKYGENVEE